MTRSWPIVAGKQDANFRMTEIILDASAVIAFLRREKGAEIVALALPGARMSAVNVSEVAAWLSDAGAGEKEIRLTMDNLDIDYMPFDAETALQAGVMRKATRSHGLSLGDRACLALARKLALPVLTADRAWSELKIGVDVQLIRE